MELNAMYTAECDYCLEEVAQTQLRGECLECGSCACVDCFQTTFHEDLLGDVCRVCAVEYLAELDADDDDDDDDADSDRQPSTP